MPQVQKPTYEVVQGTAADQAVDLSTVEEGKTRVYIALNTSHSNAGGLIMIYTLVSGGREVDIQSSNDGFWYGGAAGLAGIVYPEDSFPIRRPKIMLHGGQNIRVRAAVVAAGFITIVGYYYEWYHDYEPIPWQVHLL